MKKTIITLALALGMSGLVAQNGDLYKRYATISGNYHFDLPQDYIVEGTTRTVGLIQMDSSSTAVKTVTGMIKVDLNAGTSITGKVYAAWTSGFTYIGNRVLAIGGNYYLLGSYSSTLSAGVALTKVNGSTGAVMFSEYLSGKKCSVANLNPTDMVYDGSAYIYVLGSLDTPTGLSQTWVAKFDLNGVLQWEKALVNNPYGSAPQNIHYYNDTCIYIGAKTSYGFLQTTGVIIRIDNNAVIKKARTISYFTFPNGGNLRMSTLNIKRNGNNLYVVAQPLLGRDDVGGLLVAKLDLNMNNVTYHVFDSSPYGFTFDPEFYFATNAGTTKILVPGNTNYYDNSTYNGYVNAFFDLNTNFLNANNQGLNSNLFGTQLSYPAASGHVFSLAQDAASPSNTDFYYMKGAPGNDHTTCDSVMNFYTEPDSLYLADFPMYDSTMTNGVCNFTLTVGTPTFTAHSICYFCALCQRTAAPAATAGTHSTAAHITLFPNPSNGRFTMNYEFEKAKDLDVEIVNAVGESVYKVSHNQVENASVEYDLSALPRGVYFIHISDGQGLKETRKIVIEK